MATPSAGIYSPLSGNCSSSGPGKQIVRAPATKILAAALLIALVAPTWAFGQAGGTNKQTAPSPITSTPAAATPAPLTPPSQQAAQTPPSYLPTAEKLAVAEETAGEKTARQEQGKPSITNKWWFWTAAAGVVLSVVVALAVTSGQQSPPKSNLGNMDALGSR